MTDDQLDMALERLVDRLDARFTPGGRMTQEEYDAECRRQGEWYDAQSERRDTLRVAYSEWAPRKA